MDVRRLLAAVQGRHKEDIVAALQLIFLFSLQLPVGIVDEYQDTWPSVGVSIGPPTSLQCNTGKWLSGSRSAVGSPFR